MALSKFALKLSLWFKRYKIGTEQGDKETVEQFNDRTKAFRRYKIYPDAIDEIIAEEQSAVGFPYTFDFELS